MTLLADLATADLTHAAALIRGRDVSSVDLTTLMLKRIEVLDSALHSYVTVTAESALSQAAQADAELARGICRGPLHGVPLGLKDLFDVAGVATGAGMTIHANTIATRDATVTARLRAAGAVFLGKHTMTEGAFSDHHPGMHTAINPWDDQTWYGSSSSGSAIATAAGLCYGTLGSDTGGSIRIPAAMNGVTGIKPTWGRVSRHGAFELAGSLDHIGPIARSVRDVAVLLGVVAGRDPYDPTASLLPVPDYAGRLAERRPLRLAVDTALLETFDSATQKMLESVIDVARELGWNVLEVAAPAEFAAVAEDWAEICAVEAAGAHAETYPVRANEYGPQFAEILGTGHGISAARFHELGVRRREFTGRMRQFAECFDAFLLPGIGKASPTLGQMANFTSDPELLAAIIVPTAPIDLCGFPSVSLPGGFTDRGTPLGFQLVGAEFDELSLLQAGFAYQNVTDFHRRRPPLPAAPEGLAA